MPVIFSKDTASWLPLQMSTFLYRVSVSGSNSWMSYPRVTPPSTIGVTFADSSEYQLPVFFSSAILPTGNVTLGEVVITRILVTASVGLLPAGITVSGRDPLAVVRMKRFTPPKPIGSLSPSSLAGSPAVPVVVAVVASFCSTDHAWPAGSPIVLVAAYGVAALAPGATVSSPSANPMNSRFAGISSLSATRYSPASPARTRMVTSTGGIVCSALRSNPRKAPYAVFAHPKSRASRSRPSAVTESTSATSPSRVSANTFSVDAAPPHCHSSPQGSCTRTVSTLPSRSTVMGALLIDAPLSPTVPRPPIPGAAGAGALS
ncbi:hypothetical protein COGO111599_11145 [Corynebacterium gottingense]